VLFPTWHIAAAFDHGIKETDCHEPNPLFYGSGLQPLTRGRSPERPRERGVSYDWVMLMPRATLLPENLALSRFARVPASPS